MNTQRRMQHHGFILPTVPLVSIGMIAVGLSLIQATSSIRSNLTNAYISHLTVEASDAGEVYANYCYNKAGAQTWGPAVGKPALTQSTDCTGTKNAAYPAFVQTYNNYRTTFSVGDLEVRGDNAKTIAVTGTLTQVAQNDTTKSVQSYSYHEKHVLAGSIISKASVSSSGEDKTCAIISDRAWCWGANSGTYAGNIGDGTTTGSTVPVPVAIASGSHPGLPAGATVSQIAPSNVFSCALAIGKVYCWGSNTYGELGNGTTTSSVWPVQVTGALATKTVSSIAVTNIGACAIAGGKIYCWGYNHYGEVGVGNSSTVYYSSPQLVKTGTGTNDLPAGYTATMLPTVGSESWTMCAVANGSVYCWGDNYYGQVGNGTTNTTTGVTTPQKVLGTATLTGKTITALSQEGTFLTGGIAVTHVCVVANNTAYCWGANTAGQLGDGTTTSRTIPTAVSMAGVLSGKPVTGIVAGRTHTCALANVVVAGVTTGTVYCWGANTAGQLGTGNNTSSLVPIAVDTGTASGLHDKSVSAPLGGGGNRGCAIANYINYCWGANDVGQLGNGLTANSNEPVEAYLLTPKIQGFLF